MNKKIYKIKLAIVFLAISLSFLSFISFSRNAKAEASISVYYLVTSDTTPIIRGTVGEAGASVSVVIIGYVDETVIASGDGSWSYQLEEGEALPTEDSYAVGVATSIGGDLIDDVAWIYVEDDYPLDIYYDEEDTSLIIFPNEYTYTSEDDQFSITFAAGTEITREGGGTFGDEWTWYIEGVEPNNERVILKLRFGIPDINLSFSEDISITFNVGEKYNGQSLNIFSRSDGGDDGWEPMNINCTVENGSCTFTTDHASYFAITEYTSIAETEEGELDDDEEDDNLEKADIDSWKAYQYTNNNGVSCPNKLVLEIKGKHFNKNAKVKIGNKKAYSVDRKSSKKIVARFCMDDLMKVKTGKKRTVSVINPDTDKEKANKKINLDIIKFKKFAVNDLTSNTEEGVRNIQRALISLGFLDRQYDTGFYGQLTTNAVMEFQGQNGISQTGYVGHLTKAKLEENLR